MKFVLALLVVAVMASGCDGTTIYISTSPSTIAFGAGQVDGGTIPVGRPVAGRLTTESPGSTQPIRARLPVQGGQSYEVQIMDGGAGGASALDVPFTVTTSIE